MKKQNKQFCYNFRSKRFQSMLLFQSDNLSRKKSSKKTTLFVYCNVNKFN